MCWGLRQHPALGGCCGAWRLLAPPLPHLLPTGWGWIKVFTPLLEGLRSFGSSLTMAQKHFVWYLKYWKRIHTRHFFFSEVWVEGKKKRKRKRIPKTNKICLTLGMAKLHTWACFTSGYVSVGQATRWTADEIIRSEKGPHLPEGSMLSWHCKGLQMGWNREYLCFGSCALYCMLVCMCEQKKKSLTFLVCRLLGFFWVVLV